MVNSVSLESPKPLTSDDSSTILLSYRLSLAVLPNSTAVNQLTCLLREYYCRLDSITTDSSFLNPALPPNNTRTQDFPPPDFPYWHFSSSLPFCVYDSKLSALCTFSLRKAVLDVFNDVWHITTRVCGVRTIIFFLLRCHGAC